MAKRIYMSNLQAWTAIAAIAAGAVLFSKWFFSVESWGLFFLSTTQWLGATVALCLLGELFFIIRSVKREFLKKKRGTAKQR